MVIGTRIVAGLAALFLAGGTSARVAWVALSADRVGSYQPLINASDTVTSTPYVLTAGQVGGILTTTQMYLAAGSVAPSQLWESRSGVYHPYQLGG